MNDKPLARPEKEPLEESLPFIRADHDRRRIGFACVGPDLALAEQVGDLEEKERARQYAACGARHSHHAKGEPWGADEELCRSGSDGILYWVYVAGQDWHNTRVTRNRPVDGRFRYTDVVRVDFGPGMSSYGGPAPRGGRAISFARDLAGIYRTPLSPREHPNVLADYRAVRARIERQNGVLRQFSSMTRARVWGSIAGWHAWTAVLSSFLVALTNMEIMHVFGVTLGLPADLIEALVVLVAGYTVQRTRVTKAQAAAERAVLQQLLPP